MEKLHITQSNKRNYYFIDLDNKVIQLVHPELVKSYTGKEDGIVLPYYLTKKTYLDKYSQFSGGNHSFRLRKTTPKDIENNILTTSQIIFEVTDKCNFQCKYCGYGELYGNYDERNTKDADTNNAKSFIDYYFKLCSKHNHINKNFSIGFYGGEPLLNINFIKDMIGYLEENYPINYKYSTTTNGLLLKRDIDYLIEKKFNLSISLDGDELSNSYRVDRNGLPTFHKIIENVNYIREAHPAFYENNVSFVAVLHNRNTMQHILTFFNETFSKTPRIGRLNDGGIHPDKKELFNGMYTNTSSFDFVNATTEDIMSKPFLMQNYLQFLQNNIFSAYKDYLALLNDYKNNEIYPTGTCLPLKRRMYVTVNGKILPCEKIGHNYCLGNVENGITYINFDDIAKKINEMYEQIYNRHCSDCKLVTNCSTCMFQSELNCKYKEHGDDLFQSKMDLFELHPDLYNELMLNATLK